MRAALVSGEVLLGTQPVEIPCGIFHCTTKIEEGNGWNRTIQFLKNLPPPSTFAGATVFRRKANGRENNRAIDPFRIEDPGTLSFI